LSEKVLITSALLYANGPVHFGHIAGAYLPADVYARFQRMQGKDVHFVCGSDEYGFAITLSAELAGKTPQEHVDYFHKINQELFDKMGIAFDHFSRTTWEGHKEPVCQFFNDLNDRGYVEERVTEQLYSEEDKRFLADRYVMGTCPRCSAVDARGDECQYCGASYEATDLINPRSKISNSPLTLKKTKHWFLRFDQFKDRLKKWLKTKNWKSNVVNFVDHYVSDLKPRSITRDSDWGISLPIKGAEGKVLYVWFDAPIGYISASKEWAQKLGDEKLWEKYWLDEKTHFTQFIGKDNIPFHAIFFPAMCMGQKTPYKMVDDLPANEFLKLEGKQFSKSSGWYIDLEEFFANFTTDQIRYYLAANAPETSDADFSWREFQTRCNSELVGKFGNFANRTLVFIGKLDSRVVPKKGALSDIDNAFLEEITSIEKRIFQSYEKYSLRRATSEIMELCQAGNVYFDAKKPWKLIKDPAQAVELATTLYLCLECLRILSRVASPIVPAAALQLAKMLGFAEIPSADSIPEGQTLTTPEILFSRVEDDLIDLEIAKLDALRETQKPKKSVSYEKVKDLIDFDEFSKLDLRVAEIVKATPVPKSNKLLNLIVDLGFEKRAVVAGIAKSYPVLSNLIGKKVVLVANLKPATIMGQESHGMVLCATFQKQLEPLFIDAIPPGNPVS
jgi:methionyl-tRNA synthetase